MYSYSVQKMNANTYPLTSPQLDIPNQDGGLSEMFFKKFSFHRTKWRTKLFLDVYLSGEE
jgi:hypothetical protein